MFLRIVGGILAFIFLVEAGAAFLGDFEIDNNGLTFWVSLALFWICSRIAKGE